MENMDSYKDLSLIIAEKQKVIDKLSHDKNSLLKIISHDIRGPFNQMFALLQLMEMEMPEQAIEGKEYIDKMYQSIISGMEMVKNLHDSRSLDQGNVPINLQNVDLIGLIEQLIRGFKIIQRIKGISIDFLPTETPIEITSDRIILKKIFECILSNSIKFSDPKSMVKVAVRKENTQIIVSISDKGPGIEEEELSKIFEKFSKLKPRPTMGESSSGLGMYLASQFAEKLGYKIEVLNLKEGKGLEVRTIIPC